MVPGTCQMLLRRVARLPAVGHHRRRRPRLTHVAALQHLAAAHGDVAAGGTKLHQEVPAHTGGTAVQSGARQSIHLSRQGVPVIRAAGASAGHRAPPPEGIFVPPLHCGPAGGAGAAAVHAHVHAAAGGSRQRCRRGSTRSHALVDLVALERDVLQQAAGAGAHHGKARGRQDAHGAVACQVQPLLDQQSLLRAGGWWWGGVGRRWRWRRLWWQCQRGHGGRRAMLACTP